MNTYESVFNDLWGAADNIAREGLVESLTASSAPIASDDKETHSLYPTTRDSYSLNTSNKLDWFKSKAIKQTYLQKMWIKIAKDRTLQTNTIRMKYNFLLAIKENEINLQ